MQAEAAHSAVEWVKDEACGSEADRVNVGSKENHEI